jgi:hypothetical protein
LRDFASRSCSAFPGVAGAERSDFIAEPQLFLGEKFNLLSN